MAVNRLKQFFDLFLKVFKKHCFFLNSGYFDSVFFVSSKILIVVTNFNKNKTKRNKYNKNNKPKKGFSISHVPMDRDSHSRLLFIIFLYDHFFISAIRAYSSPSSDSSPTTVYPIFTTKVLNDSLECFLVFIIKSLSYCNSFNMKIVDF